MSILIKLFLTVVIFTVSASSSADWVVKYAGKHKLAAIHDTKKKIWFWNGEGKRFFCLNPINKFNTFGTLNISVDGLDTAKLLMKRLEKQKRVCVIVPRRIFYQIYYGSSIRMQTGKNFVLKFDISKNKKLLEKTKAMYDKNKHW